MIEIPEQLKRLVFRFILLPKGKKSPPLELEFQIKNNYKYDNSKLLNHLANDGNYGVLLGHGLLAGIDMDSKEAQEQVKKHLPETFTVLTPTKKLEHLYYFISELEGGMNLDMNQKHYGEIRFFGQYLVAPNSMLETGKYEVIKNIDIASITLQELLNATIGLRSISNTGKRGVRLTEKKETQLSLNIIDMMKNGVLEGYRHTARFMIVKDLWNNNVPEKKILEKVLSFNETCNPADSIRVVKKHVKKLLEHPERYLTRCEND